MPTKRIAVSTTEVKALGYDEGRTSIILANPDTSAIIYVSDEQGKGLNGIPVFPESYIAMGWNEGVDTRQKMYAISDTASKYLHIRTDSVDYTKPPNNGNNGWPNNDPPM